MVVEVHLDVVAPPEAEVALKVECVDEEVLA